MEQEVVHPYLDMDGAACSIVQNESIAQFRIEGSIVKTSPIAIGPSFSLELQKSLLYQSKKASPYLHAGAGLFPALIAKPK
jgi:hypothetical protein